MAMSPAQLGTKNDCAGEIQQQFTRQKLQSQRSVNIDLAYLKLLGRWDRLEVSHGHSGSIFASVLILSVKVTPYIYIYIYIYMLYMFC
jgi:hypothetical protein